jgi:predicted nucleotidyltransferase
MASGTSTFDIDTQLLEAAARTLHLRTVVLFGSYATGDLPPGPESDVDIAVSLAAPAARRAFWEVYEGLAPAFGGQLLDLVFLADADALFRWEIMNRGRLLWGDEIEHLEDRALAFRLFVDSQDLRRLERTLFEKKMAFIRRQLRASS